MHVDPLTLIIAPALLLVAAGARAAWRLGSFRVAPGPETAGPAEPPRPPSGFDDELTGIGNRLAFERFGPPLLETVATEGREAALLVLDLDRFDAVNVAHGRDAGDRLLVAFARMIHAYLPPSSLVCRLEADTFAAILPGAGRARASAVADEIRMLLAHLTLDGPRGPLRATVSIGLAGMSGRNADLCALLQRADRHLDRAKADGRNRVADRDGPDVAASLQRRRGAA